MASPSSGQQNKPETNLTFQTPRLSFTPLALSDAPVLQELRQDPAVMQWSRQRRPDETLEETEAWVRRFMGPGEEKEGGEEGKGGKKKLKGFIFSVRERGQPGQGQDGEKGGEKVDDRVIASIGFHAEPSLTMPGKMQYKLGYMFVSRVWGRGYASEAVKGIMRWWFEYLDLLSASEAGSELEIVDKDSVYTVIAKPNVASIRVMEKCGFRVVGNAVDDETGTELAEFCVSRADCIV